MTAQLAVSERKVKRLTRERDAAREEAEALRQKLAAARKKLRVVARMLPETLVAGESESAVQELARAREEQQATAEVLRIVSSSVADSQPVFNAKGGQILVAQRVLASIEDKVKAEPVGELSLKGFHRPFAVFNVTALN